jgi:hypothetical protein
MQLLQLLSLGDLGFAMPLAAASLAWLLAARAWRVAAAWTVLYASAVCLVGASKVAYLGWGVDISAADFKAISGHATSVAAVYPLAGYLLCRAAGRGLALVAAGAGLALGALVAIGLVLHGEHTVAEAASGWVLGACATVGTLYQAQQVDVGLSLPSACCAVIVFVVSASLMQRAHIGYWMIKVALALSGNAQPFSWDSGG